MGNQVKLTFAGESSSVESSFDRVGASAKTMGDKVGEAGKGFDRAGEATDTLDTRAMGFRDTVTGVQDSVAGFSKVLKGDFSAEALVLAGMGVGDLASGFTNLIVPMAKTVATTIAHTAATVAHGIATTTVSAATKVWAGVQWLLNAALLANPIVLIVAGIVLLIGVIVLIATRTTWFQTVWNTAWGGMKAAAVAVFNAVARAWNNTIGRLSWTVPGWIPGIGGNTISVPQLPTFHSGGVVPGPPGAELLAILQAGERITPAGGSADRTVIELRSSGSALDDVLVEVLAGAIRGRGGDVQLVLGTSRG